MLIIIIIVISVIINNKKQKELLFSSLLRIIDWLCYCLTNTKKGNIFKSENILNFARWPLKQQFVSHKQQVLTWKIFSVVNMATKDIGVSLVTGDGVNSCLFYTTMIILIIIVIIIKIMIMIIMTSNNLNRDLV